MDEQKNLQQERLDDLGSGLTKTDRGSVYTLTNMGQMEGPQVAPANVNTPDYAHRGR